MKSKTPKQVRILTVQSELRYGMKYCYKLVPKLRLTGLWLLKAGFMPGNKVEVEIRPKKLIIKTVK